MKHLFSRREFLGRAALATAGVAISAPFITRNLFASAPSNTVYHASIGAGGQASSDLQHFARHPSVKLVAIADVDATRAHAWKEQFPEARIYRDWRELLDKEKNLDSLNVSTPDHTHAPAAMSAMQLGKHVYVQKPLAHDICEVRQLREFARKKKLVTQMGIQIHSSADYRLAVRLVREHAIGKIKEVHAWCGKKWGDPDPLPNRQDPVPDGLDWDLWLGTAAARPFIGDNYYHPGNWRRRLDFGTGTFGDMGCHIYDPIFNALELTAPKTVRSEGPAPNQWNWANNAIVRYVFPGTKHSVGRSLNVTWYDGDAKPPQDVLALVGEAKLPGCGSLFIGTKGVMLLPHVAKPRLFPKEQFADFPLPKVEDGNHYFQFVEAVLGKGKTTAGFDYSGPMTEAVLLGGVASRFPQTTLEWSSRSLKFKNVKEANTYLRRTYRAGWEVKGLS